MNSRRIAKERAKAGAEARWGNRKVMLKALQEQSISIDRALLENASSSASSSSSSELREESSLDPLEEPRKAAYEAFNQWSSMASPTGRGRGIEAFANENKLVADLVTKFSQAAPRNPGRQANSCPPADCAGCRWIKA